MLDRVGLGVGGIVRQPLLFWCEDTAGKSFDTGVQRVVRNLLRGLLSCGIEATPIGWDSRRRDLRALTSGEHQRLGIGPPPPADFWIDRAGGWLLVPEVPAGPLAWGSDPIKLGRAHGLRIAAIVHDLIPVKLADLYEPSTLEFYQTYYRMLADADFVIATTHYVARDLRLYLKEQGLRIPQLAVCPLAAELPGARRRLWKPPLSADPFRLITVSRWEPRKNLPRLLRGLEMARAMTLSRSIHITVVGRRGGFPDYDAEVDALVAEMPGVEVMWNVDDRSLVELFADHHASIYPSWEEGFGLPVLESLWLATPCFCHAGSAMAEVAPGGGTVLLDMTDEGAIAGALCRAATDPRWLRQLTAECVTRPLRNCARYARDVASHLGLEPDGPSSVPQIFVDRPALKQPLP